MRPPLLILFVVLTLFVIALLHNKFDVIRRLSEHFTADASPSNGPWDHPPIESVPIDLKLKSPEHRRAFYAEEDNAAFEQSMQTMFELPTCVDKALGGSGPMGWTVETKPSSKTPQWIVDAYSIAIENITQRFTSGSASLHGMQVLDEHWIAYKIQGKPIEPAPLLLCIEMVLYREAHYHAKHVELWVLHREDGFQVLSARVLGILFEDTFGLFPRLAVSASEKQSVPAPVPDTAI